MTRGHAYSSDMSTLADNIRSAHPLVKKLQDEILSLERELGEVKSS